MARFFSSPVRRRGERLLPRHPSRAANPPRPASPSAGTRPALVCVRGTPLADASAWFFHPELADSCLVQKVPRRKPPHPEKIFFVCRSCSPPEFLGAASRVLRGGKIEYFSAFHSECDPCGWESGQSSRASRGRPALSFSGGTAQIRRTPDGTGAKLLEKSCHRPK